MKTRVAIACQEGVSQAAFTVGVLKALLENRIQDRVSLVSLIGTSEGAICAFKKQIATCKRQKMRSPLIL